MDATTEDDQLDLHAKAARIAAKISLLEAEYRNAIALNRFRPEIAKPHELRLLMTTLAIEA